MEQIRRRFSKDYGFYLPVTTDETIFDRTLEIRELEKEWKDYLEFAEKMNNLEQYRVHVKEQIMNAIMKTPEYSKIDSKDYQLKKSYQKSLEYISIENVGKKMVSLDLVKANFQAFKFVSPKLVLDCPDYDTLIRKFTSKEPLIKSKKLRQIIFGMLNPKFQQVVEKYIINEIIQMLINNGLLTEKQLISVTSDEIVYESNSKEAEIKQVLDSSKFEVRMEVFEIKRISERRYWFVKIFNDGRKPKLLKVPGKLYAQVYRNFNEMEIIDKDLWFEDDGFICKYVEPIQLDVSISDIVS